MKPDDRLYQPDERGAEASYDDKLEGNRRKYPPGTKFRKDGEPCKYRGRKIGAKNRDENRDIKPAKSRSEIAKAYRERLKKRPKKEEG